MQERSGQAHRHGGHDGQAPRPRRPRAPAPPEAPVVDGYTVGRLLGTGGSATVWAGTGPDGVPCALKVLDQVSSGEDLLPGGRPVGDRSPEDPAVVQDPVSHELGLLRRVRHPGVVAVRDISTTGTGQRVLVLDLAAGGSLAALVRRRRRLPAAEAATLLTDLGPALEELHATGIVHADISPGNVLLTAEGRPLLADLGVARALGAVGGWLHATSGFADPSAAAQHGPTAASDVYGLAAVTWFALTGSPPPQGGRFQRRRAVQELSAQVPADLAALLVEALHPRPARRPAPVELALRAGELLTPRPLRLGPASGTPGAVAATGTPRFPGPVAEPAPGPPSPPTAPADEHAVTRRIRALASGPDPVPPPAVPAAAARPRAAGRRGGARTGAVAGPPAAGARPAGSQAGARRRTPTPARERSGGRPPGRAGGPGHRVQRRTGRSLVLGAGALVAVVVVATATLLAQGSGGGSGTAVAASRSAAQPVPVEVPAGAAPGPGTGGVGTADVPAPAATGATVLRGEDLPAVVAELARRRAAALEEGDPERLLDVDAPASPALVADAELVQERLQDGTRWRDLAFEVTAVQVEVRGGDRSVVLADVVTGAHREVAADGTVREVGATDPRRSRLTLVRVDGEWRVSTVG